MFSARPGAGELRLMAGLILLAIFGFSTYFYQQFYIPKLIVFYALAVSALILIGARRRLVLPETGPLLFMAGFVLAGLLAGVPTATPLSSFMQWAFYLGACLLYVAFLKFEPRDTESLLKLVLAAALVQLVLIVMQQLNLHALVPAALLGKHERLFGTVGNQEFLATLLGVGFFIGLHLQANAGDRNTRRWLQIACALLLIGLVLAHNKGALLFIGLYFLWRRYPSYKLILAVCALALAIGIFLFPDSIKGRVLLWTAAAVMYQQHLLTGVGYLQFENEYLGVVRDLFSAHPAWAQTFGSHAAMVLDAHNIFLQFAAELGTAGLVLSLLFAAHVLRVASANPGYLGAALLFMLFKCLYTVVLPSVTGMIIFMLLLARLTPKRSIELAGVPRLAAVAATPVLAVLLICAAVPTWSDYYYQQGARALFMGQDEQAVADLGRALSINRENSDAQLALAQASYQQHDYANMHRHLQDALHNRKNKDTYKIAASMYYYARRYDEAFGLYRELHAAFPQHLTSLTKLACIYMIQGDFEQAYAMAQRALHIVPREEAASDAKNLAIARQIVKDSYPHLTAAAKSNLTGGI